MTALPRALLRRWYVTGLGLAITAMLCVGAVAAVPATYQAQGEVFLLPPKTKPGDNPLLQLGGLQEVTDVLSRAISDNPSAQALKAQGVTGTYLVARDLSTAGPVILVQATDKSPAKALDDMHKVIDSIGPTFLKLQQDLHVPASSFMTTMTLHTDIGAKKSAKSQTRALIAAAALGLLLAALFVGVAERLATRRNQKRRAAADVASEPSPPESTADHAAQRPMPPVVARRPPAAARRNQKRRAAADVASEPSPPESTADHAAQRPMPPVVANRPPPAKPNGIRSPDDLANARSRLRRSAFVSGSGPARP